MPFSEQKRKFLVINNLSDYSLSNDEFLKIIKRLEKFPKHQLDETFVKKTIFSITGRHLPISKSYDNSDLDSYLDQISALLNEIIK